MSELEQLQSSLMARLRGQISPQSFATWFRVVKVLSLEKEVVELGVPNNFWADWLKSNFLSTIKNNLQELLDKEVRLRFTVEPQLEANETHYPPEEAEGATSLNPADAPEDKQLIVSGLSPKYTFDNFVVGASNQFVHAAAVAVAESPAKAYNPLFIYGGVGLGKTHLLHAIGNLALANGVGPRSCYLP